MLVLLMPRSQRLIRCEPCSISGSLCHVGKQSLVMDGTNLFHRLIILVERTDDVAGYIKYKLTAAPASLYKCGYMRKTDKLAFAKEMKRGLTTEQMPSQVKYVVDGGALLHRVRWLKNFHFQSSIPAVCDLNQ